MFRAKPSAWQGFALRRLFAGLRIGDDVLRHLFTFQRLGAAMEATPPRDALAIGARTVLRAVRTRGVVDFAHQWHWPRWLEQQLDPDNPAFTARGHLPVMQNVTDRTWTLVGNAGSAHEAIVDPTGLVTPRLDSWSLDWWVKDGDGWRFPSKEHGVEQRLVEATPVVRTTLPLDGGDATQHVYAVECVPELVAVEVENRSPVSIEVALALRPYNPEGLAVVERVALHGRTVSVDGELALALPDRPQRAVLSSLDGGDAAGSLDDGRDGSEVACRAGLANAAFVYALPPGERLRAAIPLAPRSPRPRMGLPWRSRMRTVIPGPGPLPRAETVARDWHQRLDRGMRVELPDEGLQEAVDANRAFLLLLHDPGSITAGPFTYHRFWFRDAAYQLAALNRWGLHAEAVDVLRTYPGRQRRNGYFHSQWREWDSTGAAIWSIAEHHRLTGDDELLASLATSVIRGARWIAAMCADDSGKDRAARGLMPAGISAEHLGPFDYYHWDNLWSWRGLLDAAAVARWSGDATAADGCAEAAGRMREAIFSALERVAERTGKRLITAGPTRDVDPGMIGGLAACYPLELLRHDDPWLLGTLEEIREHFTIGPAYYQGIAHTGLGTYLTLQIAFVELAAGDPRAWQRLRWLLDAATPTHTWAEAIHPRLAGGCMGDGHHGWMAADLLNFVRCVLVRETDDGLALLSVLPPEWRGRPLRVRDAPTHHGRLSYELRWDGEDALLEWTLDRPGVRITAPGLDPDWHEDGASGQARLRPTRLGA
jgi:hypothetical protein